MLIFYKTNISRHQKGSFQIKTRITDTNKDNQRERDLFHRQQTLILIHIFPLLKWEKENHFKRFKKSLTNNTYVTCLTEEKRGVKGRAIEKKFIQLFIVSFIRSFVHIHALFHSQKNTISICHFRFRLFDCTHTHTHRQQLSPMSPNHSGTYGQYGI